MNKAYTSILVFILLLQSLTVGAAEYQNTSSGMKFSWLDTDYISVYTTDGTLIKYYPTSTSENTATLQSGFGLVDQTQYYAYTPYNTDYWDKSINSLPISYLNQYQQGNGSTDHLSAYDYQMASFTTGTSEANISFTHVGALIHVCWTMPVMAKPTRLTLTCQDGKPFTTDATMDLTTQTLTATEMSDTLSLTLKMVTQSNKAVVEAYMLTPPVDLTDKTLKATLYLTSGKTFEADVKGTNLLSGHIYPIAINAGKTTIKTENNVKMLSKKHNLSEIPSITSVASLTAYSPDFILDAENVFEVEQPIDADINDIKISAVRQGNVFNLEGQRIKTPTHGDVYIINGKKIVKR